MSQTFWAGSTTLLLIITLLATHTKNLEASVAWGVASFLSLLIYLKVVSEENK